VKKTLSENDYENFKNFYPEIINKNDK